MFFVTRKFSAFERFRKRNTLLKELLAAFTRRKLQPAFESLEKRELLAVVNWNGGAGEFNWFTSNNWDTNSVPTASDDVVISNIAANASVNANGPIVVNTLTQTAGNIALGSSLNASAISQAGTLAFAGPTVTGVRDFYKADGNATDISGTNSGTFVNGATTTNFGKIGQAFTFDGVNDYVNLGNDASLNTPGSMTIAAWIKFDLLNGGQYLIADFDVGGNVSQGSLAQSVDGFGNPRLNWHQTTNTSDPYGPNNGRILNATTNLVAGQWYHVAVVRNDDAKTVRMFLNGLLEGSSTYTGTVVNLQRNKNLGVAAPEFFNTDMHGQLDEVGFYNRALTPSEITALATASNTLINGSTLRIPTGTTVGPVSLTSGGTLSGSGTVGGLLTNSGTVAPGNSPGIIIVNGNYVQNTGGSLNVEIQGTQATTPDFDQLIVNGTVTLAGAKRFTAQ